MVFHRLTRSNSHSQGFTLIELLVTLAIVGIFAAIAAPSLQNFVLNNRIRAQAAALTSSLAFARTEAITRGTRVVTCPGTVSQADLAGGPKTCECVGEKWESGWLVFADTAGNKICKSDELLEVRGPLDGNGTTLRSYNDAKSKVAFFYFSYNGGAQGVFPDGTTDAHSAIGSGTFELCDHRGESQARAIQVLATGRIRTLTLTDIEELDRPSRCEVGTGLDMGVASGPGTGMEISKGAKAVLLAHLNKNNKFEQGVYFDLRLDWEKSNGTGNRGKTKRNRNKHFGTTDEMDPDIVSDYKRFKEATGTLYIP